MHTHSHYNTTHMVRTWADIADRGLNVIFPTRYYTHIHKRIEYQPSLEPIDPRNGLYSYVCGGRDVMLDLEACVCVYIFECMRKLSSNVASARQSPSIDKKHFVRHTTPRNRCAWTHSLVLRCCWQFLHQLTLSTLVINIGRIAKEFRCGRLWRLNVSNSINNTTHTQSAKWKCTCKHFIRTLGGRRNVRCAFYAEHDAMTRSCGGGRPRCLHYCTHFTMSIY